MYAYQDGSQCTDEKMAKVRMDNYEKRRVNKMRIVTKYIQLNAKTQHQTQTASSPDKKGKHQEELIRNSV